MNTSKHTGYDEPLNSEANASQDGVLFGSHIYKSPIKVLNACIRELSSREHDIKKIEIFEDPPLAIIDIENPKPVILKKPWFNIFRNRTVNENAVTRIKLCVTRSSEPQSPFYVKYEVMSFAGR